MNYSIISLKLESEFPPNSFVNAKVSLLVITAVLKLYQQSRSNLKQVHVYQMNIMIGMLVSFIISLFNLSSSMIGGINDICYIHFFRLTIRIILNLDILLLQMDRFLAFWKPFFHRASITLSIAITASVITKIVSIIAAFIAIKIDPYFLICSKCFECVLTRPILVYLTSCLCICTVSFTLIVSIYILTVTINLNKVHPQLNINLVRIEHEERRQSNTSERRQETEEDAYNLEVLEKDKNQEATESTEKTFDVEATSSSKQSKNQETIEHPKEELDLEEVLSAVNSDNVQGVRREIGANKSSIKNQSLIEKTWKSTISMNLLTLGLLLFVPGEIVALQHLDCERVSISSCTSYLTVSVIPKIIRGIVVLAHPVFFLIFLHKRASET